MSSVIPSLTKSNPVPVVKKSQLHGVGDNQSNDMEKCPMWLNILALVVIFGPFFVN